MTIISKLNILNLEQRNISVKNKKGQAIHYIYI